MWFVSFVGALDFIVLIMYIYTIKRILSIDEIVIAKTSIATATII